ncbi:MAG: ATP-grasp domain-containing protein [Bacteroidales bacterium]|nr:ATP-grasp domain-containing protein [Bacteroidales bacterium]MBN2750710.1 ATP-grasp domain-containing protein [Bacteroidales bacterium]
MITKLLITNRGEIAIRIIRTAQQLGIKTVALYATDEGFPPHARLADEAYSLGTGSLSDTYLSLAKVISIARESGANAIHPGYGFLSENAAFAEQVEANGITFIGPTPQTIALLGDKVAARNMAQSVGIPVLPAATGSIDELSGLTKTIGFPMLIKPAGGGGGKGMYIVKSEGELQALVAKSMREAASAFGNGSVYLEKYMPQARHIEVQIVGDGNGNVIHLYERECSVQRRYQKVVEEAPAVSLSSKLRETLLGYAVKLAKEAKYLSAGTVEFLVGDNNQVYFLEVNTRIQVEHPVTEAITGLDIVELQLNVAQGFGLGVSQSDININGHAIEVRAYAEKPFEGFAPSTGKIAHVSIPTYQWLRAEHALEVEQTVTGAYDPMLAKLIVTGANRNQAAERLTTLLRETQIHGLDTNLDFLLFISQNQQYRTNQISTEICNLWATQFASTKPKQLPLEVMAAFALLQLNAGAKPNGIWEQFGAYIPSNRLHFTWDNKPLNADIRQRANAFSLELDGAQHSISQINRAETHIAFNLNSKRIEANYSANRWSATIGFSGLTYTLSTANKLSNGKEKPKPTKQHNGTDVITSPLHGRIISLAVKEGQVVNSGDALLTIESMKMENSICAPMKAIVGRLLVSANEQVSDGAELVQLVKI